MTEQTYDRVKLRAQLARHEGRRLRVYRCTAGKLSIGIGRNLDDVGIRAAEQKALGITVASVTRNGVTDAQCDALFESDIDGVERDLDRELPWWRTLSDVRQRVLLDMCFNLGIGCRAANGRKARGLLAFINTLTLIRVGNYTAAASAMCVSLWARQVGQRATRLADMMKTGKDAA